MMPGDEEMSWSLPSLSEGRISLSDDGEVATLPHHRQQIGEEDEVSALQCRLQESSIVVRSERNENKRRKLESKVCDVFTKYKREDVTAMKGDPKVGSSSSSAIKKRKNCSKVWEEMRKYTDTDGKVKADCKHCKKTFDGSSGKGTTHLKNHLERCPAKPKRKSGSDGRDGDEQDPSLSPSIKTKELARLIKEKSVRALIRHFSSTEGDTNNEVARLIKEKSVIRHFSSTEGDTNDEDTSDEEWEDLDPGVLNSRKDEILQLYREEKEKLCQFLNNFSCRFTLQLVCRNRGMDRVCLLEVNYIDDSWEPQSKIISFWRCPRDHIKNLTEAVKQSCMDWKIDTHICFLVLSLEIDESDVLDNEIGKMESWFSQRRSLPFAGCLLNTHALRHYVNRVLRSEDYVRDGMRSLNECAAYVHNQSTLDELIQLDTAVRCAFTKSKYGLLDYRAPRSQYRLGSSCAVLDSQTDARLDSAVKTAISSLSLESGPSFWDLRNYFRDAVDSKKAFLRVEQVDYKFRSINLSKQKWDEVTATFEHLEFLLGLSSSLSWETRHIPITVDLPFVDKILTERCNHAIEECPFCQKVMKEAIDLFFSKHYLVRVIGVILDPRFKMDGLQLHYKGIYGSDADRYLEKVNKDFRDVYDAYAATDSSNSKSYRTRRGKILGRPSSRKSELDLYMKELKVPAIEEFDILAWWRGNAPFYPTLARMARDYLAFEEPFNDVCGEGALNELQGDIDDINDKFKFCDLPEIITPLLCLKGLFISDEY